MLGAHEKSRELPGFYSDSFLLTSLTQGFS